MVLRVLILLFILILSSVFCSAQSYQPGFRTIGAWEEDPPVRLDVNIWYPTLRQPKDLNYPPWVISGALNAKPCEGKFPLLLISHASPADRFAYHELAAWLAREGFVVVCPTHKRDYMDNMDDLFTWQQLLTRAQEIGISINLALREDDLAPMIDRKRIGLIGFGSGATTALLLGGALPDCATWPRYCDSAGNSDPYCFPWARDRISALCRNFPLRQSLANPDIKAIAAIAPGFGMLFDSESFTHFYPPLLLIAAGRDSFNRAALHCERIARLLGKKARFLDLPLADAGALISPCPRTLADDLPELCLSMDSKQKAAIQTKLKETLLAFFSHYLIIPANLPRIPAPPDLSVAPEQPTQEIKTKKKKGTGLASPGPSKATPR